MGTDNNLEYASKYDLNTVDQRLSVEIQENREKINEHSKEIARLEAVYESLENLPNTISNLDKTMLIIGNRLAVMENNIDEVKENVSYQKKVIQELKGENAEQNQNITRIDNKSKIDWADFVTKNFWKILCIFGGGYAIIKLILEGRI